MGDINNTINVPDIDTELYKNIFFNGATQCRRVTRSEAGVISCKSSQLVYIIIALLWNDTSINYHEKAEKVSKIYEMCDKNRNIRNFLLNNPISWHVMQNLIQHPLSP